MWHSRPRLCRPIAGGGAGATSPRTVRRSFRTGHVRAAVDVTDSRLGLIDGLRHVFLDLLPGGRGIGKRIFGEGMQIAGTDQIAQALRGLVLVLRVLIDGKAQAVQSCFSTTSRACK